MTEIRKNTDPCRCCWHCRYFIRPIPVAGLLDGRLLTSAPWTDTRTSIYSQTNGTRAIRMCYRITTASVSKSTRLRKRRTLEPTPEICKITQFSR